MPFCPKSEFRFPALGATQTSEAIQRSEGRANLELEKRITGAWAKHIGCKLIPFVIDAEKETFLVLQRPLKKHLVTLPGISKAEPL